MLMNACCPTQVAKPPSEQCRTPDGNLRRFVAAVRDNAIGLPLWVRYQISRPLTILVLGMHRSGTSFITRVVNIAGASLGGPVVGANPSNPAGHWESEQGLAINDLILQINGGSWDEPPQHFHCPAWMCVKMRRFLGSLHWHGTAVWKDPRTVLTFHLWKRFLVRYRIVAIFRHPMSVARSLERRDGFSITKGLQLWRQYNERLLRICAAEEDVHWIDFDTDPDRFYRQLLSFASSAGLRLGRDALAGYSPSLRTSDAREESVDDATKMLYERLRLCSGC